MKSSVLCPSQHGIPHHRPRLFIVGTLKTAQQHAFEWPPEVGCLPLKPFLREQAVPASLNDRPPPTQGVALKNWLVAVRELISKGIHPLKTDCVINVDGKRHSHMVDRVPCLTATRASNGGHWVTSRGRRMYQDEMQTIMGITPGRLSSDGVSDRQFQHMLGNAMAVNVLERIFVRLLPAVGLVHSSALIDRWGTGDGQQAAARALWLSPGGSVACD